MKLCCLDSVSLAMRVDMMLYGFVRAASLRAAACPACLPAVERIISYYNAEEPADAVRQPVTRSSPAS